MTTLLEVRNIIKHYPGVTAVNEVSFDIGSGICFGLLGPNGAGKTTTVEMLEGVLEPDSGEISYKSKPIGQRFRQEAGIMFQSTALQDFITVRETMEMFQKLYSKALEIDELVDTCSLHEFLDRDTHRISGGQRQRLLLAIALINDPQVVFLDEPTTGLDPQSRRNFWDLVERIKKHGKTIILTTHYMEEAYVLCDEIAIMDHGKIIARGTPKELLAEHYNDAILEIPEIDFTIDERDIEQHVMHSNGIVEIATSDINSTVKLLLERGVSLRNLQIRARTLEDLFLQLTGKDLRT